MSWSCADCGQGVDCHVDPITEDETEPLCYDCAEARMRRRELWAKKFGPMTHEQVLRFEAMSRELRNRRRLNTAPQSHFLRGI